jgi:hypothetical protein
MRQSANGDRKKIAHHDHNECSSSEHDDSQHSDAQIDIDELAPEVV